jgi:polysaccharide biosynthesis protein VpsJ
VSRLVAVITAHSTPTVGIASSAAERAAVTDALRRLENWGRSRAWAGTDPYDGLNATRLTGPLKHTVLGRRVLTQLVKRSPANLRPVLGIPRARSAATVAHVTSSYALGAAVGGEALDRLSEAVDCLEGLRCAGFDEPCWGYHFDVQTRVFFYPAGSPNTIASAFAGLSLLDAHEATGELSLLERAVATGDFFLRHVPQTDDGDGAFFGYLVADRTPIHNANALVCALLARLARHTGRVDMRAAAETGVRWTVDRQRSDGSWPYGEQSHLNWVDNFHTGYVLDSLIASADAGIDIDGEAALERGLAYYRRALFLDDGTPKYLPHSVYPLDAQCVAQAIQTMTLAASRDDAYGGFAWKVFDFAQRRMLRRDGSYLFQRRRRWANAAPHMRWMAAPMLKALSWLRHAAEAEA